MERISTRGLRKSQSEREICGRDARSLPTAHVSARPRRASNPRMIHVNWLGRNLLPDAEIAEHDIEDGLDVDTPRDPAELAHRKTQIFGFELGKYRCRRTTQRGGASLQGLAMANSRKRRGRGYAEERHRFPLKHFHK